MEPPAQSVGAGKLCGCKEFLPEFSQTCPKRSLCEFCLQLFSHKDQEDLFWCDLQKKVFLCFSASVGRHFFNVGHHFCPEFQGFCSDFRKIKTFGGALTPLPPTPLTSRHHLSLKAVIVSLCLEPVSLLVSV